MTGRVPSSIDDRVDLHPVFSDEYAEILDWSQNRVDKGMHDYCALAGAVGVPHAAEFVKAMLQVQQHRGDDGVGIYAFENGTPRRVKEPGRVDFVFQDGYNFSKHLPGDMAIGHNRYSTLGKFGLQSDLQPFADHTKYGHVVLAHNGQLHNAEEIRDKLLQNGSSFSSTSDSEILLKAIAQSSKKNIERAMIECFSQIPFAYSLLIKNEDTLYAIRDPAGVRPLSVATINGGYLAASEDCAFRIFQNAEKLADVKPGEILAISKDGIRQVHKFEGKHRFCSFECVYFSAPRTSYNGRMHEDFRKGTGIEIYDQEKEFFDFLKRQHMGHIAVVPILDSGKQGSIGLSEASGIPYKEYFLRHHNAPGVSGRAFLGGDEATRREKARRKLDLRKDKVLGKVIITGDDSMVRGTTMRENNDRLRDAGAEKIINVMLSPTIVNTCHLGVNHQTLDELVAHGRNLKQIAKDVHADQVIFLALDRHKKLLREFYGESMCTGCFGGRYPKADC